MSYVDVVDDTICALITAPGLSGISVIRMSGRDALSVGRTFCVSVPAQPESHKVYFTNFKKGDEVIDEVLVTYFAKGKSFTGDETLEISTHGGYAAANRVLSELSAAGIRNAERGEFSFRAFYNGKIDMVQAEGVLSIINSRSDQARDIAVKQLKGQLSGKLLSLETNLIQIMAQLEASIDFSTEDIDPYSLEEMTGLLDATIEENRKLVSSFKKGRVISGGIRATLAGPPNVGKSSLYNSLLGEEKAIVTDIAGTTRDLLEGSYKDLGMPIALVDSAGLRSTGDTIEKIGIERTRQSLENSDVIFFVLELGKYSVSDLEPIIPYLEKTYFVFNKLDQSLNTQLDMQNARNFLLEHLSSHDQSQVFFTSSINGEGLQHLRNVLDSSSLIDIEKDEALITQHRHFAHLSSSFDYLLKARQLIATSESYDLIALEVQSALKEIFAVLGKEFDEQVLDQVFKQFCIGK